MVSLKEKFDRATIEKLIANPKGYKYTDKTKIFNVIQRYHNALIIDFRTATGYGQAHLQFSINFAPETTGVHDFMYYSPEVFTERFALGKDKARFQKRKRLYIFLIPSENSVEELLECPSKMAEVLGNSKVVPKQKFLDAKGLLCAYLLYKGLQAERIHEIHIFPKGFKSVLQSYPYLCLYSGTKIYVEPQYIYGDKVCVQEKEVVSERNFPMQTLLGRSI
eukprot:TRINITY_DN2493_c0_g1_i1.p4 TRINITY_DN2493_c0_g1~~TRINITY_DN2493_c0_g1_i1.p4  ORF type:complete len:221 (+),score=19.10 TRINITY_DN2493_c0_g1_i1:129-791(+)